MVAERPLPSASGPSSTQYDVVFPYQTSVRSRKLFDGIRYLDMSPQTSGSGCDISIYPILWNRMERDMILRSIAINHATSHHLVTPKHQAKTTSTKTHHLVAVYYLSGAPGLAIFLVLPLSMSFNISQDWPYRQKTAPFSRHDSIWYLSACLFCFILFSLVPCLLLLLVVWYSFVVTTYLVCCYY